MDVVVECGNLEGISNCVYLRPTIMHLIQPFYMRSIALAIVTINRFVKY